jgi:hypothetical protein
MLELIHQAITNSQFTSPPLGIKKVMTSAYLKSSQMGLILRMVDGDGYFTNFYIFIIYIRESIYFSIIYRHLYFFTSIFWIFLM